MKLSSTETELAFIAQTEDNHQLENRLLAEPEQPYHILRSISNGSFARLNKSFNIFFKLIVLA
jgi:hypothetical protein